MENLFIPYEQCLQIKLLGFEDPGFASYENWYFYSGMYYEHKQEPPTKFGAFMFAQIFKWFREEYFFHHVISYKNDEPLNKYEANVLLVDKSIFKEIFYTYEAAELACLKKMIELT